MASSLDEGRREGREGEKGGREGSIDERKEEFGEGGKDGGRDESIVGEGQKGRKVNLDIRKNSRRAGDRNLRTDVGREGDTESKI